MSKLPHSLFGPRWRAKSPTWPHGRFSDASLAEHVFRLAVDGLAHAPIT